MNPLQQKALRKKDEHPRGALPDRRRETRVTADRPLYVQPADSEDEHFEEVATMQNLGRNGIYFETANKQYRPGMGLYVIPAFGGLNLEYFAEVVRIEDLPSGGYGVAIRLLRLWNLVGMPIRKPSLPIVPARTSASAETPVCFPPPSASTA